MPDAAQHWIAESQSGLLVLVVGPSGAGKDTLIAYARERLGRHPAIVFPRRVITRPAVEHIEDHETVSEEVFRSLQAQGRFALHWTAHGLLYGIPADIDGLVGGGRTVVVNVSRSVIEAARRRYANMLIICIDASPDVLAARLARRGRESQDEILQRQARAPREVGGADVVHIRNDGPVPEAGEAMLAALRRRLSALTA